MLDFIPNIIIAEENDYITKLPDGEEVKKAIFSLSGNSAAGPDGFTRMFFQE